MKTNPYIRTTALAISVLFICSILWSFSNSSSASEGTKKYCEVVYDYRVDPETVFEKLKYIPSIWGNFSNYPNGDIENKKLKTYTNAIDALNYMGANGWRLIQHYQLTFSNTTQDVYLMEK